LKKRLREYHEACLLLQVKENHLRWDSLGEFLALAVSIEDLAAKTSNAKAATVAAALNAAVGRVLSENKSPGRKVGLIDNRGSHFYLALYWAEALATEGGGFAAEFGPLASALASSETTILAELHELNGTKVDLGG